MAKLMVASQSALLLPQLHTQAPLTGRGPELVNYGRISICSSYKPVLSARTMSLNHVMANYSAISYHCSSLQKGGMAVPVSASSVDVELPDEKIDTPDVIGGGGDEGNSNDRSGGGGGGGGGDDNSGNNGDEGSEAKRNNALSMSQKLTLGYAALVGLGGFMGYLKSGSQKSLASGGFSALLLYYVYTELPKRPVFASALGLGLSAALLVVMGTRFKKSGKVFPAGVVSLVSFIMTGGYLHGIMRTSH